jgi:hypothetical protein
LTRNLQIESRLNFAKNYLINGEIEACFAACEQIEKLFEELDMQHKTTANDEALKQFTEIKRKLNSIMANEVRKGKHMKTIE